MGCGSSTMSPATSQQGAEPVQVKPEAEKQLSDVRSKLKKANSEKGAKKRVKMVSDEDFAGVLTVHVKEARGLHITNSDKKGKHDPFVVLSYADQTFKTPYERKTTEPVFDATAQLLVESTHLVNPAAVRLSVYDYDILSNNDFMGMVDIHTKDLIEQASIEPVEKWYKLMTMAGKRLMSGVHGENADPGSADDEDRGEILVSVQYKSREQLMHHFWEHWFKAVDANEDGTLSKNEFYTFCQVVIGDATLKDKRIEDLFHAADSDTDERISASELSDFLLLPENKDLTKAMLVYHWIVETNFGSDASKMQDSFLTEQEAKRGWLFRMSEWISGTEYELGVNTGGKAASILVKDRYTGVVEEEQIAPALNFAMRIMYQSSMGSGMLNKKSTHDLLNKLSIKQGKDYDNPKSEKKIGPFIRSFGINMDEALLPESGRYPTFNEFFFRKLKPGARPIACADDASVATSPADCRAVFFPSESSAKSLWIKGKHFTVSALIGEELAAEFVEPAIAVYRLAPQDYHRFHYGVTGKQHATRDINGALFTVNPVAVNAPCDVFTENKRCVTVFETEAFGKVCAVAIGATMVGSINLTGKDLETVTKGEEHGYFAFGGSTVIYLYQNGRITFDADLVEQSNKSVECWIRMGDQVGVAC